MDKVQKTITSTHIFEANISEHVRVAYAQHDAGGASLAPSIQVWNSDWSKVVDFAIAHNVSKIRVDNIARKDNSAISIYAVQLIIDIALDQYELVDLHKLFALRGIYFIHYEHAHNPGQEVLCTWVFFMPSLRGRLEDVMVELRDGAASWPVLVNVNKQSTESVKESFDYFMESFHLPIIKENKE